MNLLLLRLLDYETENVQNNRKIKITASAAFETSFAIEKFSYTIQYVLL